MSKKTFHYMTFGIGILYSALMTSIGYSYNSWQFWIGVIIALLALKIWEIKTNQTVTGKVSPLKEEKE